MMHAMKHPVLTSKKRDRFHMNSNGPDADTCTSSAKNIVDGQGHIGRAWGADNTDAGCVLDQQYASANFRCEPNVSFSKCQ